jgi:hypothetical protein
VRVDGGFYFLLPEGLLCKSAPRRGIQRYRPHDHIPTAEITSFRRLKSLHSEPLDPRSKAEHTPRACSDPPDRSTINGPNEGGYPRSNQNRSSIDQWPRCVIFLPPQNRDGGAPAHGGILTGAHQIRPPRSLSSSKNVWKIKLVARRVTEEMSHRE